MFKKVTEEEFEVLSKYHPSEIRFYVDMSRTVKPKRSKKTKANGSAAVAETTRTRMDTPHFHTGAQRDWKGKGQKDRLIALGRVGLGNISKNAAAGTIRDKVVRSIAEVYHGNAFSQFRRSTLIAKIMEATTLKDPQINPIISNLITAKKLRVVQEDATSPLDVPKAGDKKKIEGGAETTAH